MKNVLFTVAFVACSGTLANAQTIADVARRERAQRPPAQSSVTITNANLKKKSIGTPEEKKAEPQAAATTTAPAPTPAAAPAATPQAAAAPANTQDEKWWRERFESTRTEIRRAENQVAVAQLELNSANRDYLTRAYDPDGRGPAAIAAATKKLDDANKAVTAGRAKLAQLEEELRRAGAPAGWAR